MYLNFKILFEHLKISFGLVYVNILVNIAIFL